MELTPEQKRLLDSALPIDRIIHSDDWPAVVAFAQEYSRQLLNNSAIEPDRSSAYCAGGAKAVLDFIDYLADIPRQKDAMLAEASKREAAPKGPKSSSRTARQEPSDL